MSFYCRHDATATERGCSTSLCATLPWHATLQAGAGMWSNLGALPCMLRTARYRQRLSCLTSLGHCLRLVAGLDGCLAVGGPPRVSGSGPPLSPPTLNGSAGADRGPRRLGPLSSCGGWSCPAGSAVCRRCWGRKCSGPCLFLDISLLISVSRSSPANSATPRTHDVNCGGLHERRRARLGRWIRNPSVLPWGRGPRDGWYPVPSRFGFSSRPDNEAGWRVPDKTQPDSLPQMIM